MMRRANKYGAIKTQIDNLVFDSQVEGVRYVELKLLLQAGHIRNLRVHPKYVLTAGISYKPDFEYEERGPLPPLPPAIVVEDVKSKATRTDQVYRLKRKLFEHCYPDIRFEEVMR